MPFSSSSGKSWVSQTLRTVRSISQITNILDIGPGSGTYYNLYSLTLPQAKWTGVEVWKEYISKYNLSTKYHKIINKNALEVDYQNLGNFDICFAGDVLEHVTKEQSILLMDRILDASICAIISIPIIYMPQGAAENNPHEIHVKDDWSHTEILRTFSHLLVDDFQDDEIGVYLLSKNQNFIENYSVKSQQLRALTFAKSKVEENPDFLYYWFDMAKTAYMAQEWHECFYAAEKAISKFENLENYAILLHDFAALAAHNLRYKEVAVERGTIAANLGNEQRLKNNLEFYKSNLNPT